MIKTTDFDRRVGNRSLYGKERVVTLELALALEVSKKPMVVSFIKTRQIALEPVT